MAKIKDLTGKKFGELEVVSITDERKHGKVVWLCKCSCGNLTKVISNNLQNGSTVSCGCYSKKVLEQSRMKHGMHDSRIYNIYICMKERCYNPKSKSYSEYGGRGIKICDEWLGENGFLNFYDWAMQNGYDDNLTIDRKNVDGDYCRENCRWATHKMQNNNTRRNRIIKYQGQSHSVSEWSQITGINRNTLTARLNKGLPLEDVFKK